jgi:sortase (surface protein transpeptidase)
LVALIALAVAIAVTTTGAASAHSNPQAEAALAKPAETGAVLAKPAVTGAVRAAIAPAAARTDVPERTIDLRREHLAPRGIAASGAAWTGRASTDTPAPSARSQLKAVASGQGADAPAKFSGRNRVWIPALGIRRSVSFFSCSRSTYPGDRVYRWGCAGRNNVYLFGHAHSVFKPLHDAYVRGRLRKGMKAYFADGNGRVGTYKVVWWKVTTPDRGEFAYAAQSRPSMTLQTCVGARSQYRLIVRLVKVD